MTELSSFQQSLYSPKSLISSLQIVSDPLDESEFKLSYSPILGLTFTLLIIIFTLYRPKAILVTKAKQALKPTTHITS